MESSLWFSVGRPGLDSQVWESVKEEVSPDQQPLTTCGKSALTDGQLGHFS